MVNNVLFVDDEVHILKAIKRGLYKETYNKFFATSGSEALEILEKEDIHVIVTDMKMPKMNGLELLTIVKEKYPKIIKIILSGYTQLQQIIVTINKIDIYKFITKPWDIEVEFKEVIQSAIDLYNTREENDHLRQSLAMKNELYQKMLKSNNEKLMLIKNDFSFLSTVNKDMADYIYRLAEKMGDNQLTMDRFHQELNFIFYLMGESIKFMPSTLNEFNRYILLDRLTGFIKNNTTQGTLPNKLTITTTVEDHTYRGDYNILLFGIKSFLKFYFQLGTYDTYSLVLSERGSVENEIIELVFLLKSADNHVVNDQIRIETMKKIFQQLFMAYRGSISLETKDEEHLVLIKFPVQIIIDRGE